MIKRSTSTILSVLAALFVFLPTVAAAQETTPPLAEMWMMTIKPGHGSELNKALAEHMKFRSENGDPRDWQAYTPLLGEELNRVGVRYCCFNWADLDSYREWGKNNAKVGEHFEKHVAPHVEHYAHYFETMHWNNSHWADSADGATLYAVTEFHVKPGHGAEFRAARDKLLQIALNQGWATEEHSWLWTSTVGGPPVEGIVIPYQNFAGLDREADSFSRFLAEHLGEDGAAELMKQFASSTSGSNYQIWEHQKDLSMDSGD
jgi:hypothetical protein